MNQTLRKESEESILSLINPIYSDYLLNPEGADFSDWWSQLDEVGAAVIPEFIQEEALQKMAEQNLSVSDKAYYKHTRTNIYNTEDDPSLPAEHPVRQFMDRTQAFVAKDLIPQNFEVSRLYHDSYFQSFIAHCLREPVIYEYADPFAGLVLNVCRDGCSHPWHYDTNEFIVSMLTNPCEEGGVFEYCPQIRKPGNENYENVSRVLAETGQDLVKEIHLKPGDLQIFKGRFSLHRVTTVRGPKPRITSIFAYAKEAGMMGKAERSRQIFGRVSEVHREAEANSRQDKLLD